MIQQQWCFDYSCTQALLGLIIRLMLVPEGLRPQRSQTRLISIHRSN